MAVVFQPIVDLRDTTLVGYEALTRFPDGVSPERHLAAARACGTLVELELELLSAIRSSATGLPDGTLVTCNASGTTFRALEAAAESFDPRLRWGLELSESSAPAACTDARRISTALGCLLLLDDAGQGHSTIERITELRPDVVKLDRSLVVGYAEDASVRSTAHALADAARAVGARILTEGTETRSHVEHARALGAHYAQGFLFGRPEPLLSGALPPGDR